MFSAVPRPLLSGYPDQPLLLPPSFLRHHPAAWWESVGRHRGTWRVTPRLQPISGSPTGQEPHDTQWQTYSRKMLQKCPIIVAEQASLSLRNCALLKNITNSQTTHLFVQPGAFDFLTKALSVIQGALHFVKNMAVDTVRFFIFSLFYLRWFSRSEFKRFPLCCDRKMHDSCILQRTA